MPKETDKKSGTIVRPPVVAVLGHIDHGKSTLLDYIRTENTTAKEAGGITQHISSYETDVAGKKVTFIDTPGHEAFGHLRSRGASIADVVILVVSAEDGVKDQTKEAVKAIKDSGVPFVVAINKTDAANANVEKTIASLAENEIYLEGHGGDIPYTPVSAKTGDGISDLLDTVLLVAEVEELTGSPTDPAEGVIIEANQDSKRGISATLLIKSGTIRTGSFIAVPGAFAPVRIMEDFAGNGLKEASFSTPVTIVGWSNLPSSGENFTLHKTKKEAELASATEATENKKTRNDVELGEGVLLLPLIIKADVAGTLGAIRHELDKIENDRIVLKILSTGVGDISESDVKLAGGDSGAIIMGFNVKIESAAKDLAERLGITMHTENIIYKLTEWLEETAQKRVPKRTVEKITGRGKILKIFSRVKDKQVIGGRVEKGTIGLKNTVKILRRGEKIGTGIILELQESRTKVDSVREGSEFGVNVESRAEIATGDVLETITIVEE
jgi:translation initiation factor IF-2